MNEELSLEQRPGMKVIEHELARLRKEWWCFLLLGIVLIVGGVGSIAYPLFTSVGVVLFLGVVLMISGIATIISAFWAGRWSAFMVQILVGLLYTVSGFVITDAPITSVATFTLMIAGFFVVAGGFRIISALVEKYPQWGWALANGIVTLMLGLVIFRSFRQLPEEPSQIFWIIGLLVGIELIFSGWTWVMLSFVVKNLPAPGEMSRNE